MSCVVEIPRATSWLVEAIFDHSNLGMAIMRGPTFIFERVNARWQRLVSDREYIGKTWQEAYPEVEGGPLLKQLRRVYETGMPLSFHAVKIAVRAPSGLPEDRYYDYSYVRIADDGGQPYGIYSQTLDVTEKVKARIATEKSEHRLKMALSGARMGTWILKVADMMLHFDPRFGDLHAVIAPETPWHIVQRGLHPDDAQLVASAFSQAARGNKLFSCDYRIRQKDGTYRWISSRGEANYEKKSGKLLSMGGIAMDITDLKDAEEGLQKAVKARDIFLGVASHELKTPLTSWKLQCQIEQRRLVKQGLTAFTHERLTKIFEASNTQVNRLVRLVDDMLDVSRIASGKLSMVFMPVDVSTLVRQTVQRMEPLLSGAGCRTTLSIDEAVTSVVDACRIEQVIVNLLTNVTKYAPQEPVKIELASDDTTITLLVQDHGPGIPDAKREYIFERFERLISASEVSGLGLGLPIVREIVRAHGGDVHLQRSSTKRRGCTFVATWPKRSMGGIQG